MNIETLGIIKGIVITILTGIVIFLTIFAPEALFYKTEQKSNLFDRWNTHSIAWNIHQSLIHFLGSLAGAVAIYYLIFNLRITEFSWLHLVLLLVGLTGLMGFIPMLLFNIAGKTLNEILEIIKKKP